MRESLFERISLSCPVCRRVEKSSAIRHTLELKKVFKKEGDFILEGFLACSGDECPAAYPIVAGVPVIFKEMGKWWESGKKTLVEPKIESSEIKAFFNVLEDSQSSRISEKALLGTYLESHFGDSSAFSQFGIEKKAPNRFRRAFLKTFESEGERIFPMGLDLGCSVGGYAFEAARFCETVVGVDNFFPAVRAAEIQRTGIAEYYRKQRGNVFEKVSRKPDVFGNVLFMVADALDPPFEAEFFDLVIALNLIENVEVPLILLGQMNALLKKSGTLIFSSPYEWREDFSEPVEWLEREEMEGPVMIKKILKGEIFPMTGFSYEITDEQYSVPWTLRHHARYCSVYRVHLLKARKLN